MELGESHLKSEQYDENVEFLADCDSKLDITMEKNYYRILEIPTNATDEQIKKAYKRLVKMWHPDLNNNSTESQEKLKEINEAYEILSDSTSRIIYNQQIFATNQERTNKNSYYNEEDILKRQKEEKERRERVRQRYESQQNTRTSYEDFERIIKESQRETCTYSLIDKFDSLYSDLKFGMEPNMLAISLPVIIIFAIFWHGCDLVCRVIEYFFKR